MSVGYANQPINICMVLRSQAVTAEFTVKLAHFSKDFANFPLGFDHTTVPSPWAAMHFHKVFTFKVLNTLNNFFENLRSNKGRSP